MSDQDKDATLLAMANTIKAAKNWWPVAVFLWALIEFAVRSTSFYDNNVAKKPDVTAIEKKQDAINSKIDELSKQVADLSIRFNAYKENYITEQVSVKQTADSNRRNIASLNRKYNYILSFFTRPFKIVDEKRVYQ